MLSFPSINKTTPTHNIIIVNTLIISCDYKSCDLYMLYSIDGGESETFVLTFVCSGDTPPGLLEGVVTVTYLNENKAVQTIDHTLLLPIEIVCNPCPPGDGCYKVWVWPICLNHAHLLLKYRSLLNLPILVLIWRTFTREGRRGSPLMLLPLNYYLDPWSH